MFFNNTNIDNIEYYKLLNVDRNASSTDIKKSYRKLAMKHHPDKGGDQELFKKITEAFQVLNNEDKRKLYDSGGKEAVAAGVDRSNIFNMFNNNNASNKQKKGSSTEFTINLSLNDIYKGVTKYLNIKRLIINKNSIKVCNECNGSGVVIKRIRMGPMLQQVQQTCPSCNGNKYSYSKNNKTEKVEVIIPKGIINNKKVILYEKGDDIPDGIAGDIHVIINEKKHNHFTRKGFDLYYKKKITLVEALCGLEFDLEHLDGRKLLIKTDDIIIPNTNPLNFDNKKVDWIIHSNKTLNLQHIAIADIDNEVYVKRAIEQGDLKDKNITAYRIYEGRTYFYDTPINEINNSKKNLSQSKLFIKNIVSKSDLVKCIEDEGMPNYNNPVLRGNLYLIFEIEFPKSLSKELKNYLLKSELNKGIKKSKFTNSDDIEINYITEKDPLITYNEFLKQEEDNNEDFNDDEEQQEEQPQQCTQQ